MKIISQRKHIEEKHYEIFFQFTDSKSLYGFGFPALSTGEVDLENLQKRSAAPEFKTHTHSYSQPAIGCCDYCKAEVVLDRFTNTCECGRDYNGSGQLLAARSQWGEETGETYADISDL